MKLMLPRLGVESPDSPGGLDPWVSTWETKATIDLPLVSLVVVMSVQGAATVTHRTKAATDADPAYPSFDAFVRLQSQGLMRVAYALTRHPAQAEDLLQASLLKMFLRWNHIRDNPEAYARTTIMRTFLNSRRFKSPHAADPFAEQARARDVATSITEQAWIRDALRRLPPRQRAVIFCRYYEDLTDSETAKLLDCSIGTVKSQLFKARTSLKKALESQGESYG